MVRGLRVRGSWWARTDQHARAWLLTQGFCDIRLWPSGRKQTRLKVDGMALSIFYRQLAVMFASGIPLADSLRLTSYSEDIHLAGVSLKLGDQVCAGHSLSEAMRGFPSVFNEVIVALVAAAETSGAMSRVLGRLAQNQERAHKLRKSVMAALTYPAVLLSSTLLLWLLFVFYIYPINRQLLSNVKIDPSSLTAFLYGALDAASSPWLLLALVCLTAVVVAFFFSKRSEKIRQRIDDALWLMPAVGPLRSKMRGLETLEILSLVLGAGGTVDHAMRLMISAATNERGRTAMARIRQQVMEGGELGELLQESEFFPPMVGSLLQIGYETGRLEEMALRGAELCEEDIQIAIDTLTALLEPLMLAFAGGLCAVAIMASAAPMLQLLKGL